jgi:RNA polymerase sigma-70 factor, ECF subfamily
MADLYDTSEIARAVAADAKGRKDESLERLLAADGEWLRLRVSTRLGGVVRRLGDTDDFVQEAMLRLLRVGPWFKSANRARFRALLARIVENLLRDAFRAATAEKRSLDREISSLGEATLDLDRMPASGETPSAAASRAEREAWVRLGLELLESDDRAVIWLRQIEGRAWADVGLALGLAEDAARMRFRRALGRLARIVRDLRSRGAGPILDEETLRS